MSRAKEIASLQSVAIGLVQNQGRGLAMLLAAI
jgi:hypothetical protein